MSSSIAIIPYKTGNIKSVYRSLENIGVKPYVPQSPNEINKSSALILPGVGHFGRANQYLQKSGFKIKILELASYGTPILGICLGFHLLTFSSEESSNEKGFELFPLNTKKIISNNKVKFKVPHIGWNKIDHTTGNSSLFRGIESNNLLFYFCNSYGVKAVNSSSFNYSIYNHESNWLASFELKNVFGVQFHPEKSRSQGLQVLRNFADTIS